MIDFLMFINFYLNAIYLKYKTTVTFIYKLNLRKIKVYRGKNKNKSKFCSLVWVEMSGHWSTPPYQVNNIICLGGNPIQ